MAVPKNVILLWPSTNASIPSGWVRESALDGLYPKAWGSQNPNVSGGANTHSHTSTPHGHNMNTHGHSVVSASNSSPSNASNRADNILDNHDHGTFTINGPSGGSLQNASPGWSSANHEPLYYTMIFVKPPTFASPLLPGLALLWNDAAAPDGWSHCNGGGSTPDLRNRYLKGAAAGLDAGDAGGALTHSHDISHGHTANSHSHTDTSAANNGVTHRGAGGGISGALNGHTHQVTLGSTTDTVSNYTNISAGSGDTVEPAYKKVAVIQNTSVVSQVARKGMIGLWLGSVGTIPPGWVLCDGNNGAPDLRDNFMKVINTTGELGNTGGANTHNHSSISHTHVSTGTHSHGGSTGGPSTTAAADTGGDGWATNTHTHPITSVSNVTATYANSDIDASTVDNQPAYLTVAYIMLAHTFGGAILATI